MRDPEDVQEELHDMATALDGFRGVDLDRYPGGALLFQRLSEHRDDLRKDLEGANTPRLAVVVRGDAVANQTIRIGFLTRLLGPLQKALDSVGQSLLEEPTSRGQISGVVREAVDLRLFALAPGSVQLTMVGPAVTAEAQTSLDSARKPTVFERSTDLLLDILENSHEAQGEEWLAEIAEIGSRAVVHLRDLSGSIIAEDVATELRWLPPAAREERIVSFDLLDANRLQESLTATRIEENDITLKGRLVGASLPSGRFELETENRLIRGRVDAAVIEEARAYWLRHCTAFLKESIAESLISGAKAASYTLVSIEPLPLNVPVKGAVESPRGLPEPSDDNGE